MAHETRSKRYFDRTRFTLICLFALFLLTLPIGVFTSRFPGPDVLLLIFLAFVIRAPNAAPVILIAFLALLADLILMRPPGLQAAAVVISTEYIRLRQTRDAGVTFIAEWTMVAGTCGAVLVGSAAIAALFGTPAADVAQLLIVWLATTLTYPVIIGALKVFIPGQFASKTKERTVA